MKYVHVGVSMERNGVANKILMSGGSLSCGDKNKSPLVLASEYRTWSLAASISEQSIVRVAD